MEILILKLGATGDVVRTSSLLQQLKGNVTWLNAAKNTVLLEKVKDNVRCFSWEQRDLARDRKYDLAINLEDDLETGAWLNSVGVGQVFGAYLNGDQKLSYTDNSRRWFDLSLISTFGRQEADRLKAKNRP